MPGRPKCTFQMSPLVFCARVAGAWSEERWWIAPDSKRSHISRSSRSERIRAGGAGIPAFYTPTGVGTPIAEGKQEAEFDGVRAILERGIVADLALVRAHRADAEGNLRYRLTARNFNPLVATAGRVTIAEADEILPEGEFVGPDDIHTPGIYVQHLVAADPADKEIEQRTLRSREA